MASTISFLGAASAGATTETACYTMRSPGVSENGYKMRLQMSDCPRGPISTNRVDLSIIFTKAQSASVKEIHTYSRP